MNENKTWGETPENISNNPDCDIAEETPEAPDNLPDSFPKDEETDKNFTFGASETPDIETEEPEIERNCCNHHNCNENSLSDSSANCPSGKDDFTAPDPLVLTAYPPAENQPPQANYYQNPTQPQQNAYYVQPNAFQAPPQQQPPVGPYGVPYQPPYPQGTPQWGSQPNYAAPNAPYTGPVPQPAPKKKGTGAKVMLICLWVLLGLFSVAIVSVVGYYLNDKDFSLPGINYEDFFGDDFTFPADPEKDPDHNKPDHNKPDNNDSDEPSDENSDLYNSDAVISLNDYPNDQGDTSKYNTKSAFEKVSPSTVGIMCYSDKERTKLNGQGTGIIIDKNGYIATNSHVIGDSKSYYISVVLDNGDSYTANVVGYDTRTDLAVVKITASGLTPAEFADSEQISIGEDIIAVGNPGGMKFQNTLTRGVVSAKDRTLDLSTQVSYIQTDAAINPGNSGGPLCNLYGQVIGINSAKIADAYYEGMGFAIPSTTVKDVVDDLIKQGYVDGRVKIGITGTVVSRRTAEYNNVPVGILISEITEGGPCDNGEIKVDDIICKLDDYTIESFNDIYIALTHYKAGDEVTLKIYSTATGEYYESDVILQADNGSTTID